MVVGYPGRTYRRLTQSEMRERHERYFPSRAALYQASFREALVEPIAERMAEHFVGEAPAS